MCRTNKEQLRLIILKKLRTASLNSKFIGSYKKKVYSHQYISYNQGRNQDFAKGGRELKNEKNLWRNFDDVF